MQGHKLIRKKDKTSTADEILQKVTESTNKFTRALEDARDEALEGLQIVGDYTAFQATSTRRDVNKYGKRLESVDGKVDMIQGVLVKAGSDMKRLTVGANTVKKGIDDNTAFMKRESEKNDKRFEELPNILAKKMAKATKQKNMIASAAVIAEMRGIQFENKNLLLVVLNELQSKQKKSKLNPLR